MLEVPTLAIPHYYLWFSPHIFIFSGRRLLSGLLSGKIYSAKTSDRRLYLGSDSEVLLSRPYFTIIYDLLDISSYFQVGDCSLDF